MLVVARTVTALNRLLDVLSLIHGDRRIQVVFTTDPDGRAVFRRGVDEMLADMGAAAVDWDHAMAMEFDLVIAASENDRLHLLRGPILLVQHGFGHQKYYPNGRVVAGMNPERLVRDGRVVPTVIGISHPAQRADLAITCPPAVHRAAVIGDPALDRMLVSRHHAGAYRRAFSAGRRAVVLLASTWGRDSLLGRWPELPEDTAAALSVDTHRTLILLHPGVWAAHSRWQLQAWLTRARAAGLLVVDPRYWQAALIASHAVISDQSSLALYAAALGKPLALTDGAAAHTVAGSPLDQLAAATDRLDPHADLNAQIDRLIATPPPPGRESIVAGGVSEPGSSARVLRGLLYELLRLHNPNPGADYPSTPGPDPQVVSWTTLVVSVTEEQDALRIRRTPALRHGFPAEDMDYRHLIAHLDTAPLSEVSAASIITCTEIGGHMFSETAPRLLAEWPNARLVVTSSRTEGLLIGHAHGRLRAHICDPPTGFDSTVLASLVYVRMVQGRPLEGIDRLALGERIFTVRVVSG